MGQKIALQAVQRAYLTLCQPLRLGNEKAQGAQEALRKITWLCGEKVRQDVATVAVIFRA